VLSYVAQLEEPTAGALKSEKAALTKMTPGPGMWITAEDCWHLKESFGVIPFFESLAGTAWAAKVRVCAADPQRIRAQALGSG